MFRWQCLLEMRTHTLYQTSNSASFSSVMEERAKSATGRPLSQVAIRRVLACLIKRCYLGRFSAQQSIATLFQHCCPKNRHCKPFLVSSQFFTLCRIRGCMPVCSCVQEFAFLFCSSFINTRSPYSRILNLQEFNIDVKPNFHCPNLIPVLADPPPTKDCLLELIQLGKLYAL